MKVIKLTKKEHIKRLKRHIKYLHKDKTDFLTGLMVGIVASMITIAIVLIIIA